MRTNEFLRRVLVVLARGRLSNQKARLGMYARCSRLIAFFRGFILLVVLGFGVSAWADADPTESPKPPRFVAVPSADLIVAGEATLTCSWRENEPSDSCFVMIGTPYNLTYEGPMWFSVKPQDQGGVDFSFQLRVFLEDEADTAGVHVTITNAVGRLLSDWIFWARDGDSTNFYVGWDIRNASRYQRQQDSVVRRPNPEERLHELELKRQNVRIESYQVTPRTNLPELDGRKIIAQPDGEFKVYDRDERLRELREAEIRRQQARRDSLQMFPFEGATTQSIYVGDTVFLRCEGEYLFVPAPRFRPGEPAKSQYVLAIGYSGTVLRIGAVDVPVHTGDNDRKFVNLTREQVEYCRRIGIALESASKIRRKPRSSRAPANNPTCLPTFDDVTRQLIITEGRSLAVGIGCQ